MVILRQKYFHLYTRDSSNLKEITRCFICRLVGQLFTFLLTILSDIVLNISRLVKITGTGSHKIHIFIVYHLETKFPCWKWNTAETFMGTINTKYLTRESSFPTIPIEVRGAKSATDFFLLRLLQHKYLIRSKIPTIRNLILLKMKLIPVMLMRLSNYDDVVGTTETLAVIFVF